MGKKKVLMDKAFELQADMSITKHLGSMRATEELIRLLNINNRSYILDIGCGVGATPCWIAKKYGCRVVGVDIRKTMIKRAKERAKDIGVEDRVEFRVANAHKLPFKTNTFDVVMSESVLAVLDNRKKAIREYVRVAKKGGKVGTNEVIWLKKPSKKLEEETEHITGKNIPDHEGWVKLFKSAKLKNVEMKVHKLSMWDELIGRFQRYGIMGLLKVWSRAIPMLFTNKKYKKVMKETLGIPWEVIDYWGYVIITGRK